MEYINLGQTDIKVSRLCVGCMSFGDPASNFHAWTLDADESESLIKHALDLGINFFDTANTYSAGTSEEYLGRAIRKHIARDQVVLATKVYFNEGKLSRQAILREIDGSLKRLGTDYVDLYIIHRFDYETPIEETMETARWSGQVGQSPGFGRFGHVWLPVSQFAAGGGEKWLDEICLDAESLQLALQGRRAGADPDLPRAEGRTYSV